MRSIYRTIFIGVAILLGALSATGCAPAATGPAFTEFLEPEKDKALLYVVRSEIGGGVKANVVFNEGEEDPILKNGIYIYKIEPGLHQVSIWSQMLGFPSGLGINSYFDFEAGKRYYSYGDNYSFHLVTEIDEPYDVLSEALFEGKVIAGISEVPLADFYPEDDSLIITESRVHQFIVQGYGVREEFTGSQRIRTYSRISVPEGEYKIRLPSKYYRFRREAEEGKLFDVATKRGCVAYLYVAETERNWGQLTHKRFCRGQDPEIVEVWPSYLRRVYSDYYDDIDSLE